MSILYLLGKLEAKLFFTPQQADGQLIVSWVHKEDGPWKFRHRPRLG